MTSVEKFELFTVTELRVLHAALATHELSLLQIDPYGSLDACRLLLAAKQTLDAQALPVVDNSNNIIFIDTRQRMAR